jgi:transposase
VGAGRTKGLRQVTADDAIVALRLLVDRRDRLGEARTETISRIHQLLLELIPGGVEEVPVRTAARALLATVRPRDVVGRTRRQLAAELVIELAGIDKKTKAADRQLTELVAATGSSPQQPHGIGPSGAARLLGDIADIARGRGPHERHAGDQGPPRPDSLAEGKRHALTTDDAPGSPDYAARRRSPRPSGRERVSRSPST